MFVKISMSVFKKILVKILPYPSSKMQVFYLQQGLDHGTLRKLCRAPIHEKNEDLAYTMLYENIII